MKFSLFRKAMTRSEVDTIVDQAVQNLGREFFQWLILGSGRGEFMTTTIRDATQAASQKVMFKQADNKANNRADDRDDLYQVASDGARKLIEYRVANQNFANALRRIVEDARSKHGDMVADGAEHAARPTKRSVTY